MDRIQEVLQLRSLNRTFGSKAGKLLRRFLYRSLGFEQFNSAYSQLPPCSPAELSGVFLEAMEVRTKLNGKSPGEIPGDGPLVVVSNHPFGLIEGMALDVLLQTVRRDSKVMAVNWLEQIPECDEHLILVGPPGNSKRRGQSIRGWREAISWLKAGHALAVFPAGRVARFQWRKLSVDDLDWSAHIAATIRRTGARIVPIYFHGSNSLMFNVIAALAPPLVDFRLVREFINKRKKTLRATIGRVIEPAEMENFMSNEDAIQFLRRETEALASIR